MPTMGDNYDYSFSFALKKWKNYLITRADDE